MRRLPIVFAVALTAWVGSLVGQTFETRLADLDERALDLQKRLHENELRLQQHAEMLENARRRLEAVQAGRQLPPRTSTPVAPPEPRPTPRPPILPAPTPPAPVLPPDVSPVPMARPGQPISKTYRVRPGPEGYYFQLFSGYVVPSKGWAKNAIGTDALDFEDGHSVGVIAGIDWGTWRTELELSRRSYKIDNEETGNAEANSLLFNLYWERAIGRGTSIFAGAGLGPSLSKVNHSSESHSKNLPSFQLAVGLGQRFTDSLSGRLAYKYFSTATANTFDRLESHGVDLALGFDL